MDLYKNIGNSNPERGTRSNERTPPEDEGIITRDPTTLRAILNAAPVAIQIVGQNGTFLDCNLKTLQLFRAHSPGDVIGNPPGILSPLLQRDGRSSKDGSVEMINQAFSGKTVTFKWDHQRFDGEIFPAQVTLNLIQYEGSDCLMASVIDLSDQVNQLNAMAALVQEAPFSILTVTPDIEISQFNPAYLTITGYSKEEASRKKFKDYAVIHREGGTIEESRQTKQTIRGRFICDFGTGIRHLNYTYIPVMNHKNEVTQIYHIMSDQTDLMDKLNEFDALITESPAGIITMDSHTKIISANTAFSEISQIPVSTLISMQASNFKIISRTGPSVTDVITEKKSGKGILTGDFSGKIKNLEYHYIPIIDTKGRVVKIIGVYIDLTAVSRLVQYLEESVKIVSEHIGYLAEGKTNFVTHTIPADEHTHNAFESFSTINKALNHARVAIERMAEDSHRLTEAALAGDLSYRSDPSVHQGEFQAIISGINQTLDATIAPVHEAIRISKEYARYNFTARFSSDIHIKGEWVGFQKALDETGVEVSHVISTLNQRVQELSASIEEASASVEEITSGAQEISTTMGVVNKNSTMNDQSLSQIIYAMEDLNQTVSSVSRKADSVAALSQEANEFAKSGMELVKKSDHSMAEITKSSEHVDTIVKDINVQMNEIGKIVRVISDIANQTNLLSLNAAIEAARAGEAGRGFAVVASEVKSLAQDSRRSAENISELIQGLQSKAKSAGDAMRSSIDIVHEGSIALSETVTAFTQIATTIDNINMNIMDVAASSEEQAASVEEVTASMQEISEVTHKTSEEVISTSAAIKQTSVALDQISQVLNSIVEIGEGVHNEISQFTV
ncbi:MAG TPA: methyl-accepting chemotaxis protein [Methanospirillum sp.]|nr:methyl-accepting chemotaxis protein [Methanospirillum sp.]